jgi:hypothetical protein
MRRFRRSRLSRRRRSEEGSGERKGGQRFSISLSLSLRSVVPLATQVFLSRLVSRESVGAGSACIAR